MTGGRSAGGSLERGVESKGGRGRSLRVTWQGWANRPRVATAPARARTRARPIFNTYPIRTYVTYKPSNVPQAHMEVYTHIEYRPR